jgi:hypothetical protein
MANMDDLQIQLGIQQSLVTDCNARVTALGRELAMAADIHSREQARLLDLGHQMQQLVDENERLQREKQQQQEEIQRLLAIGRPDPLDVAALQADRASIVAMLQMPEVSDADITTLTTRLAEIDYLLSSMTISPRMDEFTRRLDRLSKAPAGYGGRVVQTVFAVKRR